MAMFDSEIAAAAFSRETWMVSGHVETMAAFGRMQGVQWELRNVKTPDGDEVLINWIAGESDKPLLVLYHGLEGCAQSRAVGTLAAHFAGLGWTVAAPHFRSCGRPNLLPRAYHAADGEDVRWMMEWLCAYFERQSCFAIGVSLGGNALIQCMARLQPSQCAAAAAISTPLNLPAAAHHLSRGLAHLIYGRHFVKLLRAKIRKKLVRYPALCAPDALRKARTIADVDRIYTAPVHRFASAEDYWQRGSADSVLDKIRAPLLCVNAANDPLVPAQSLPQSAKPPVYFCRPRHGGHGAFFGRPRDWLARTVQDFFAAADGAALGRAS